MSHEARIQKAVITAAADLASGGKLNDAQSDALIDYVFDESSLSAAKLGIREVRFRNENLKIEKIGVGQRVTVAKTAAVDPGTRRGVTTSTVTLTPSEFMTPFEVDWNFFENNLEGEDVEDHLIRMFAAQTANDVEELDLEGSASPEHAVVQSSIFPDAGNPNKIILDTFMALHDGLIQKADGGNLVDAGGAALSARLYSRLLNAMPTKFKRNKKDLVWLCSHETEQLWRDRFASRATSGGDNAMNSQVNLTPFGIELAPLPLFPHNPQETHVEAFTGAGTVIQLPFAPILEGSEVVVDDAAVIAGETDAYTEGAGNDYVVDYTNGTITQDAAGTIGVNDQVRVTYRRFPTMILTARKNIIKAIGRDLMFLRDQDIYKVTRQFSLTGKVDIQYEELTAVCRLDNFDPEA